MPFVGEQKADLAVGELVVKGPKRLVRYDHDCPRG
jgi:hypothetical protein